ncbi:MAG: branched-chain amino acid ABC transporter permease [Clostridiales bacterium]|nr:branched-chain amino acid ABC transporter permease [Clostridiales bacterium]
MQTKKSRARFFGAALLIGALIAVAIALPQVFTKKYHTNLMNQCLINIIVVTGLNFITGMTGQMNMGTAGIFSLGAYTSALMTTRLGTTPWLGLLGAILMGCLIGICLGYPSLRLKGVYLSLTTIGFSEVVRIFITNLDDLTGGAVGVTKIAPFQLFGMEIKDNVSVYYLYLAMTAILVVIAWRLARSKWGRAFKAIKDNPEAMESSGVNIASLKIMAFTLAAIYGCIGGSLYAHFIRYINPATYTLDFSINYVIMLVIGGLGTVPGGVLGAILVTLTPELLRFLENYYWFIYSIITLLFVVFLPNGMASVFARLKGLFVGRIGKGGVANGNRP